KTFAKLASENGGIENLYKKLQSLKPEKTLQQKTVDKILNGTSDDDFGFEEDEKTYSDIRSFFKDAGYQPKNNWLYEQEGQAIFQLVEVFVKNKDILASQEEKDEGVIDTKTGEIKDFNKFENYLFDFDRGADIKSDKIEGMSESEIKNFTTKENFPNLIANLELGDSKEFAKNLMKDPTLKTQFHERLKLVLGTLHTPEPLFIKNGDSKFFKEYLKLENNFEKEIIKQAKKTLTDEKIKEKLKDNLHGIQEKLTDEDWNDICDKIRLQGIGASLGVAKGIGLSFNIEKLMNGWLDSLEVGVIQLPDGKIVPGIGVSKQLLQKNITENTEIHSNTGINTVGFFINLGTSFTNTEQLSKILQSEKNGNFFENMKVSGNINYINIWGPLSATSVGINLSEMDEENFAGAEKMVEQMGPIMDIILEEIEKGTSAEKLDTSKIIGKEKLS
ncbi:hypothetical protein LR002_00165, partial [Candidatus Gracilibacteria bacterium]|nr:hypothetical protein [Candidatus Gracilibacteria bacterium]